MSPLHQGTKHCQHPRKLLRFPITNSTPISHRHFDFSSPRLILLVFESLAKWNPSVGAHFFWFLSINAVFFEIPLCCYVLHYEWILYFHCLVHQGTNILWFIILLLISAWFCFWFLILWIKLLWKKSHTSLLGTCFHFPWENT